MEDESNKDIYEDTTVQPTQRNNGVYDNTFVEPTSKGQNDYDGSLYYNSPNVLPAMRLQATKPVRLEEFFLTVLFIEFHQIQVFWQFHLLIINNKQ